jgi:hypothetical protein
VRIGVTPLLLAIAVAATRLTGAVVAADALAYVYLAVITSMAARAEAFTAPQRV